MIFHSFFVSFPHVVNILGVERAFVFFLLFRRCFMVSNVERSGTLGFWRWFMLSYFITVVSTSMLSLFYFMLSLADG